MTQRRRNIQLMILLTVLCVITIAVYWIGRTEKGSSVDKTMFQVPDLRAIDDVTLESPRGKIELKYSGSRWMINDQYKVDRQLIDLLFATLQQAEPKRAVAASLRDSLGEALRRAGIKVSLLASGKIVKSFYAGGNTQKTTAYFEGLENSTPYVMTIPGYRVYTAGIFELDVNGWREKRVFDFNWRNFKDLNAYFSSDPGKNFTVGFNGRYFGINGASGVDTLKLNNYLDAVSLVQVSQYGLTGNSFRNYDSLLRNSTAAVRIDVRDVSDKLFSLSLYPSLPGDAYVAGKVGEEPVLFTKRDAMSIQRTRDYFLKKP